MTDKKKNDAIDKIRKLKTSFNLLEARQVKLFRTIHPLSNQLDHLNTEIKTISEDMDLIKRKIIVIVWEELI